MMAIMNKLWLTSLVLAWWMQESHDAGVLVLARPLGAPVCPTGRSAPGDPHRPGSGFTEGEIADSGDLMIAIDGEELMVGTPMDVSAGMSHNVTITSTGSFFRGVLAILSDSADATVDTTSLISIMDGEQDLQISSPCLSSGLGGVTQTNNTDKTSITFMIEFEQAAPNMALDVNVVRQIRPSSIFFYSRYTLNAVVPPVSIYQTGKDAGLLVADLVDSAGLASVLDDPNAALTLLAPVNDAFAALPGPIVERLTATENVDLLTYILTGHVIPTVAPSDVVISLNNTDVTFLNNATAPVRVTPSGQIFVSFARVVQPDIMATNGVVHLIDRVLGLPSFVELLSNGNPQGTALQTAFEASGLAATVAGFDGATLFAPVNSAFITLAASYGQLGTAVLTQQGWVEHIKEIILAHVFPEIYFSEDLVDGTVLTAMNGENFAVSVVGQTVNLSPGSSNGVAPVLSPNILTSQGVVHTVGGVLLPSYLDKTVVDVVADNAPTLASLLVTADLVSALETAFPVTIFAPTDAAFAKLDSETTTFLTSDEGIPTLKSILQYHVLEAVVPSSLVATGSVTTMQGDDIDITVSATTGTVMLNGVSTVTETDLLANNGIVHLIDTVLTIPGTEPQTSPSPTSQPASPPTTMMPSSARANVILATASLVGGLVTAFLF